MKEQSLEFLNSEIQNLKIFPLFEFIEIQNFCIQNFNFCQGCSM